MERHTVRTLWLTAVGLVICTVGYVIYAMSGGASVWPEALSTLLIPGLWSVYGIYAVRGTTQRLQHLERARVALEIARDENEQAQEQPIVGKA